MARRPEGEDFADGEYSQGEHRLLFGNGGATASLVVAPVDRRRKIANREKQSKFIATTCTLNESLDLAHKLPAFSFLSAERENGLQDVVRRRVKSANYYSFFFCVVY